MRFPTHQKNVFLIPYWIKNTLERHRLPATAALSLAQLRPITSAEDLVLTMLLNKATGPLFGQECIMSGLFNWTSAESVGYYDQLLMLEPLHTEGLQDRLFHEQAEQADYPEAFDVLDLDERTLLVTIYPGHFGGPTAPEHRARLVRTVLKRQYDYCSYDHLASEPLFEQYLSSL